MISHNMESLGDLVQWGPIFRRNLTELEENQLFSLLDTLSQVYVPEEAEDSRVWTAYADGSFLVKSFFMAISRSSPSIFPCLIFGR